jgi:DNA-binding response OmpR family regulator
MAAGCDAFATKPVDFAALLDTIKAVTGKSE